MQLNLHFENKSTVSRFVISSRPSLLRNNFLTVTLKLKKYVILLLSVPLNSENFR